MYHTAWKACCTLLSLLLLCSYITAWCHSHRGLLPLLIPLWHVPYNLKSLLYFAATFSALLLPNCLMSFSRRILPLLIPLWHVPYSLKSLYFAATFSALLLHNCLMSFSWRILPLLIPLWHVPYSLKSLLYFAAIYFALLLHELLDVILTEDTATVNSSVACTVQLEKLVVLCRHFSALLLPNCLMSFSRRILPLLIPLWHVPYSLKSLLYFAATLLLCSYLTAWCHSHRGY